MLIIRPKLNNESVFFPFFYHERLLHRCGTARRLYVTGFLLPRGKMLSILSSLSLSH